MAHTKVLGQDQAWCVEETVRRPVWLEQSEQGGEKKVRATRAPGQVFRAMWAERRTCAFTQREAGALEGCGPRRAWQFSV